MQKQIHQIILSILSKYQMTEKEYEYIANTSLDKKMLVFGCGRDSILWRSISSKVLFLEDNLNWIDKNYDDTIRITYTCKMKETTFLLNEYRNNNYEKLYVKDIIENSKITDESWDTILVDGPEGHDINRNHGRVQSIFMSKMLANQNTNIFVHDINRDIEKQCCETFDLKQIYKIDRLGLYKI